MNDDIPELDPSLRDLDTSIKKQLLQFDLAQLLRKSQDEALERGCTSEEAADWRNTVGRYALNKAFKRVLASMSTDEREELMRGAGQGYINPDHMRLVAPWEHED